MSTEVKKRSYSRNGCIQCKKRKFKCDEHKPTCYNCINANKECSYRQILKFKDSRSFTIEGSMLSRVGKLKKDTKLTKIIPSVGLCGPLTSAIDASPTMTAAAAATKKTTIPVSKPSVDPFLDILPQVVQNPLAGNALAAKQPKLPVLEESTNLLSNTFRQAPQKTSPASDNLSNLSTNVQSPLLSLPQSNNTPGILSQIDLENSLFSGATNLITDLNGLINSLEIDFNTLDFQTGHLLPKSSGDDKASVQPPPVDIKATSATNSDSNYQETSQAFKPSLSSIRFEGISPTSYSIASSDSQIANAQLSPTVDHQSSQYQDSQFQDSYFFLKNNSVDNKRMGTSQLGVSLLPGTTHGTSKKRKFQEEVDSENSTEISSIYNNEHDGNREKKEEDDGDDVDENDEEDEEDQIETYNSNYIQTLTKSLVDYGSPKILTDIKSPAGDLSILSNYGTSRSFFKQYSHENSKAFPHPNLQSLVPFDYITMLNKTLNTKDLELLASFFNWGLNSSHVKYLKIFVTHIHLNIIPFSTNYAHNAYLRIFLQQAKHSPHLLFAILAISARFEVYQIEQRSDLPNYEEKLNYHRTFRTYYLSSCLRSLESVLHSKQTTLNNIESLLLTIQVLASDFSGHKGSQWRTHLHGAKDLLVKYCRYRPLSLELTIVWLWFYSMEVLAALTAPHGGTIHNFDEMDEFLPVLCPQTPQYLRYLRQNTSLYNNHDDDLIEPGKLTNALVHFGIVVDGKLESDIPSRFNMYLGYDETILEVFNALVYTIECIRGKDNVPKCQKFEIYERKILDSQGKSLNSNFLLSLFALIKKARTFTYINNEPPYIVPLGKGLHPSEIIKKAFTEKDNVHNPPLEKVFISAFIHPTQISGNNKNLNNFVRESNSPSASSGESPSASNSKSPTVVSNIEAEENPKSSQLSLQESTAESNFSNAADVKEENKNSDDHEKEIYFSWVDLSQQLNADAAFLRLLTLHGGVSAYGLGIKSSLVQDVVSRMIVGLYGLVRFREETAEEIDKNYTGDMVSLDNRYEVMDVDADKGLSKETGLDSVKELSKWPAFPFDKYLDYQFDNRLVMVQWPLYVCGLCCIEPRHKAVIECCFSGLIDLGVGSGELSLKKLRKIWTLQKLGRFDFEKFNLFGQGFDDDEDDDYVPFM